MTLLRRHRLLLAMSRAGASVQVSSKGPLAGLRRPAAAAATTRTEGAAGDD